MSIRFQTSYLAALVLAGSLAAAPVFAANAPAVTTGMAPAATTATTPASATTTAMKPHHRHETMDDMSQRVEERINTLHVKLMITPDQESDWSSVAQAMRDSETETAALIHQRHENKTPMTAVEDLASYQKIAEAHAEGLDKVVSAFSTLYDDMSDAQKANADKVFGGYEGHGPMGHGMKKPVSN